MLDDDVRAFLRDQVLTRFLRYVQIDTTSDETSTAKPSTACQWDLLRLLEAECRELGLTDVATGDAGYVYATLPARAGASGPAIGWLAHVDTSPDQPGDGVVPVVHARWDGSPIGFAEDPQLTLRIADCPSLSDVTGDDIVTASGRTLLGADDKAGIAEILAAVAALQQFPELPHGELRICFTSDEEVGRGIEDIDLGRLPRACYTVDGGLPGLLQWECFDAWKAVVTLQGVGVHPGSATDRMVNAATAAARLVVSLPADQTPERTSGREGFLHVSDVVADCERAEIRLIARDFDPEVNRARLTLLEQAVDALRDETPGLRAEVALTHQYQNMREGVLAAPEILEHARGALTDLGLTPVETPIRGGTDGSLLTAAGHPTPNLFCGGQLGHSRREWIAVGAMTQAAEMLLHLARRWSTA